MRPISISYMFHIFMDVGILMHMSRHVVQALYFALRDTTAVFFSSKPRLCILADSDEESSSAGSSDEEEVPPSEPLGTVGDKTTVIPADG